MVQKEILIKYFKYLEFENAIKPILRKLILIIERQKGSKLLSYALNLRSKKKIEKFLKM